MKPIDFLELFQRLDTLLLRRIFPAPTFLITSIISACHTQLCHTKHFDWNVSGTLQDVPAHWFSSHLAEWHGDKPRPSLVLTTWHRKATRMSSKLGLPTPQPSLSLYLSPLPLPLPLSLSFFSLSALFPMCFWVKCKIKMSKLCPHPLSENEHIIMQVAKYWWKVGKIFYLARSGDVLASGNTLLFSAITRWLRTGLYLSWVSLMFGNLMFHVIKCSVIVPIDTMGIYILFHSGNAQRMRRVGSLSTCIINGA